MQPDLALSHPMLQVGLLDHLCLVLAFIYQHAVVKLVLAHHLSTGLHQTPQITYLKEDSLCYHQFSHRFLAISQVELTIGARVLVHLEHLQLLLRHAEAPG